MTHQYREPLPSTHTCYTIQHQQTYKYTRNPISTYTKEEKNTSINFYKIFSCVTENGSTPIRITITQPKPAPALYAE
jgi:hypothetical protein